MRVAGAVLALGLLARAAGAAEAAGADTGVAGPTATEHSKWTGKRIIEEQLRRNEQFPYVYEEQTMVLVDEAGDRDVRRCRRFTRIESDGSVKFLLVFDDPADIRGVALLAVRRPDGRVDGGVYLPAFGRELKHPAREGRATHFLGTDFALEDLTPEVTSDFRYVREADRKVDEVTYFVVDAYPKDAAVERATGYARRRLTIREDLLVTVQADYYDRNGHLVKRLTRHDLKRVYGESWRANMIVVHDLVERHHTLLKIDRRVYSRDYVPAEIFEPAWLLANGHVPGGAALAGTEPAEPAAPAVPAGSPPRASGGS